MTMMDGKFLQPQDDGEGWGKKAHTLSPGYARDARFAATMVMNRGAGVLQSGGTSVYCVHA